MKSLQQRGIARTRLMLFLAAGLAVIGMLVGGYFALHDPRTPLRKTGDTFMNALAKDDSTTTYNLFTAKQKKQISAQDWKKQIDAAFKGYSGKPVYTSTQSIPDPYHVYQSYAEPTRLTYLFTIKGSKFDMSIVLLKNSASPKASWQVDEWETHIQ
jgi:hypothetical protein